MDWLKRPHERRRATRVRSKGSIQVRHGTRLIRARLLDLSSTGSCARAELPLGLIVVVGKPVRVEIRLDACPAKPFSLLAHVLRVDVVTRTLAIEFDEIPRDFADCVHDELLAALEHDTSPRLILIDTAIARRRMIANAFRAAGCQVTEAATPLDAIVLLARSQFEPAVIAIADTIPESVADELRDFVVVEHPDAHMVAISRSATRRNPAESWLSASYMHASLHSRVSRVMTAHKSRSRSTLSRPVAGAAHSARS